MKYMKKILIPLILAFSFVFQGVCYASNAENTENNEEIYEDEVNENDSYSEEDIVFSEYDEAGAIVAGVMKYIDTYYLGDDVDTEELLNAALKGMTSVLDDYSEYFTQDEYALFERTLMTDLQIIGVVVTQTTGEYPVITEVIEDSPAEKAGLQAGDTLISINSEDLKNASLQAVTARLSAQGITQFDLEYIRDGKTETVVCGFTEQKIKTVYLNDINEIVGNEKWEQNRDIGYIKVDLISVGTADDFQQAVSELKKQGKKKLILDLRGNPGGVIDEAFSMCDLIVPEGIIVSIKDKSGEVTDVLSELKKPYFTKIVVLTDSSTASAAEMIASAVQDSGAGVVVGTRTFGKGIIQTMEPILDLGVIKMTTLEYFSRNGKKINKIGVSPDINVNVPLFLNQNDDIESDKVKNALNYLGYDTGSRIKIMNTIGKLQKDRGLTVTRTITDETANIINLLIYEEMNNNDKILAAGYEEILK